MKYASKETKSAVKLHPECNVMLIESKNDLLRGSILQTFYVTNLQGDRRRHKQKIQENTK